MALAQPEGRRAWGRLAGKRSPFGWLSSSSKWRRLLRPRISQPRPSLPPSSPPAPAPSLRPAAPSARGSGPRRYVVLMLAPGGLRSGRPPLQPRVRLEERGLQRGDFSLWLRPARRADAGDYRAAVHLRDRSLACSLRLRVGQASSRWGRAAGSGAGGAEAGRRCPRRPGGRKGRG